MLTLIIFLLILGVLIIVHEFGHFIAAKQTGVRVQEFSFGFGKRLLKKKQGQTEYRLNLLPLGGYVKLAGDTRGEYTGAKDEYLSKPIGERFRIIFFGPLLNYVLGFFFFWVIFVVGYPTFTTKVGGLLDGYGAKQAGLAVGDQILAVDGVKVDSWDQMQQSIQKRKNPEKVRVNLARSDKQLELDVPVRSAQLEGDSTGKQGPGLIGVVPVDEIITVRYGILRSFKLGAEKTVELTGLTLRGLWWLVTGKVSMRDSMTGPLGIFYITSKAAKLGLVAVLHLMAVLSVSLAIFNLLPLPVLDGGHITLLALEKLRGKPLSAKADEALNRTGITLIVMLAIFVTYNDIIKHFGDKISGMFK